MKSRKRERRANAPRKAEAAVLRAWHVAAGALVGLAAAFAVYQPALRGPFLFDDIYLPIYSYDFGQRSFAAAISGVRPFLMLTFWLNHRVSELEPYSYHVLNVLFHTGTSLLVFLIVRRLLVMAGAERGWKSEVLAAFGGALYLLHPVQTESVAYIASRSENLSVLFFYSALALFLYRKTAAVSWPAAAGVSILFVMAASTKEHTVVLPALLLLTDWYWNPGFSLDGIRKNWRLYVPLVAAGAAGLWFVFRVLSAAPTAGFGLKDFTWYQYFFTQCRAVWVYIRLFLLPVGQNLDYKYPISRTLFEHGAVLGLLALAALAASALYFRKRYPLSSYGILATLLLLAPTSSVVPIQDALAERRLYLPLVGLICVVVDVLRRWKGGPAATAGALVAVLAATGYASYERSKLWSNPVLLWEDVVSKSPWNGRAHFQLGLSYYETGRCEEAVAEYQKASGLMKADYRLLLDWGAAEDCRNRPEEALATLRRAASMEETADVYALIGMVYAKRRNTSEALAALERAIRIDPRFDMAYVYRGNVRMMSGDAGSAIEDYRRALALNPRNESAERSLAKALARTRGAP